MIDPDLKDLMTHMDSRYTLVVATAKRARQLSEGAMRLTRFPSDKPVTLAVHEIAEAKVNYSRGAIPKKKVRNVAHGEAFDLFDTMDDRESNSLFGAYGDRGRREPRGAGAFGQRGSKFGVFGAPGAAADQQAAEELSRHAQQGVGAHAKEQPATGPTHALGGLFFELAPDYVESMQQESKGAGLGGASGQAALESLFMPVAAGPDGVTQVDGSQGAAIGDDGSAPSEAGAAADAARFVGSHGEEPGTALGQPGADSGQPGTATDEPGGDALDASDAEAGPADVEAGSADAKSEANALDDATAATAIDGAGEGQANGGE